MVLVPKKSKPKSKSNVIELPGEYKGLLFFYLDAGTGTLYSTFNSPLNIIRAFWKEATLYDYENSCRDSVTWLYHQIDINPSFPQSNQCLDRVLQDEASLEDLSLTYLAECALVLPGTMVGYAKDADDLNSILEPVVDTSRQVAEELFRDSNPHEVIITTVHTTRLDNASA